MMWIRIWRTSVLSAAALTILCAQSPAPAVPPTPWCTRIPLPGATDFSLKSGVDGHTIHHAKPPDCRPVEIRTPRGTLRLAVATNEAQREHGLMKIPWVPPSQGMIFVFPDSDQPRSFWMKDTITPLDMVFVRSDGTISSVATNVPATPPKTPDEKVARRVGVARYVIEVGAGEAVTLGLSPGTRLTIPPVIAE